VPCQRTWERFSTTRLFSVRREALLIGETSESNELGRPQPRVVVFGQLSGQDGFRSVSDDRWISFKKYFGKHLAGALLHRVPFWEELQFCGGPPSPTPLKSLDWQGFRKNGAQNIKSKGFIRQNIDNKRVTAISTVPLYTASASTMMC
jgi:hypothetical protein